MTAQQRRPTPSRPLMVWLPNGDVACLACWRGNLRLGDGLCGVPDGAIHDEYQTHNCLVGDPMDTEV